VTADLVMSKPAMRNLLLALLLFPALALAGALTDISRAELQARQADGAAIALVDVRSPAEFAAGHIPGAVNIPVDEVAARLNEFRAFGDREIVLYCRSGRRAGQAAEALSAAGIDGLRHLAGDFPAWQAAGGPVTPCTSC
jgi:rhodanese-related sulfurtransferase